MLKRRVAVYLLLALWVAAPAQAEETCQECPDEDDGSGDPGGNETQDAGGGDASGDGLTSKDGPCQVASYDISRPQDTELDPDHCFKRTINRLINT